MGGFDVSEWREAPQNEPQQAEFQVPGLREIFERFRSAFPGLSVDSLRRVLRMGPEVSPPEAAQASARSGKSRRRGNERAGANEER
jgi:hypothetical protein